LPAARPARRSVGISFPGLAGSPAAVHSSCALHRGRSPDGRSAVYRRHCRNRVSGRRSRATEVPMEHVAVVDLGVDRGLPPHGPGRGPPGP
jgi:hypothetical protein